MTFHQFLAAQAAGKPTLDSLHAAQRHPRWPSEADRLDRFERALPSIAGDGAAELVPTLRNLWRDYARTQPGLRLDLDLALAAWGDYARHQRRCVGTEDQPCSVAEELREKAVEESALDDAEGEDGRRCETHGGSEDEDEDEDEAGEEEASDGDDDESYTTELF